MAGAVMEESKEKKIEAEIQARRTQFALELTRYVAWAAGIAGAYCNSRNWA